MEKSPQIEQGTLARMLLRQWPDGMAELVKKCNTAKTDIIGLLEMGLLSEVHLNKKKSVYIRTDDFEKIMSKITETSK